MIGVGDTTAAGGTSAISALIGQTAQSQSTLGGSSFGPAFLLGGVLNGGSPLQAAQGLYNSLGQIIGAMDPQAAANAQAGSVTENRRQAALEAAADKINAGDAQGGRAAAEALLKKDSQNPSAIALVGRSYMLERDYKQAEKLFARAAALAPGSARIQSDLANTRTLQGSDEEVLTTARRKLKNPATREEALRLLFELTDRSPLNADAYLALSDGFEAARQPLSSLFSLQKAQAFATKDSVAGVIERAQAFVEKHPDIGNGHNLLGRALQKAGRMREGLRELELARRIAPTNVTYGHDLADAYVAGADAKLDTGDLISAETYLNKAYAITPSAEGYREATGRLEAALGQRDLNAGWFTSGIKHLNLAKSQAGDDEDFNDQLALQFLRAAHYYENKGDTSLALSCYGSANELDPDSFSARYNTSRLSYQKGMELREQGLHESAIEYLDRAYQLERTRDVYRQDLAVAYDNYGVALQALGELDKAIENFEKGHSLDLSNSELTAHYLAALAERDGE